MDTVKVIVLNSTGAAKIPATLYLHSGVLEYEKHWSHIAGEISMGKTVEKVAEELKMVPEVQETEAPTETRSTKSKKRRT